jgi:TPR repeat protein
MKLLRPRPLLAIILSICCIALQAQQAMTPIFLSFAELNEQANASDPSAQEQLGICYSLGFCLGVTDNPQIKQDDSEAARWFQKAATKGNPMAELDLSTAYRYGRGVPQDNALSYDWLRKAAEAGQVTAQEVLGLAYENGTLVTADPVQARRWLQRAADQGDQGAKAEVAKLDAFARLDASGKQLQAFIDAQPADSGAAVPAGPAPKTAPVPAPVSPVESAPARGFAPEGVGSAANPAAPIAIPHNYALIFASDDYTTWPHLTNPISDADAVGKTLQALYNFQVEEIRNPTDDQILAKLTEYLHRSFQPQDQLLIFFSGHGYFDPDLRKGFIVPANALLVKDDVGHRSLIAHDTIQDYVNRIPSQHVVLVVDACFAGTLDRRIADGGLRGDPSSDIYAHASLPDLLARKEPKRTRRYITSGGKDFVPDGLPGHHSPFISAFLVTLNQGADRKGYLTLDDIQQGFDTVKPEPLWGDIQDDNDPGADFLLLTSTAVTQLRKPN